MLINSEPAGGGGGGGGTGVAAEIHLCTKWY